MVFVVRSVYHAVQSLENKTAQIVQELKWTTILLYHFLDGGASTVLKHRSVPLFVPQERYLEAQAALSLLLVSHLHRAWEQTSARKSTKAIDAKTVPIVSIVSMESASSALTHRGLLLSSSSYLQSSLCLLHIT